MRVNRMDDPDLDMRARIRHKLASGARLSFEELEFAVADDLLRPLLGAYGANR